MSEAKLQRKAAHRKRMETRREKQNARILSPWPLKDKPYLDYEGALREIQKRRAAVCAYWRNIYATHGYPKRARAAITRATTPTQG